jgi:hypothetical protein
MEHIRIQPRQHELLKTFCRLTGRSLEDVLDEILLGWAETVGKNQMRVAMGSSPFLRAANPVKRGPAKVLPIRQNAPIR